MKKSSTGHQQLSITPDLAVADNKVGLPLETGFLMNGVIELLRTPMSLDSNLGTTKKLGAIKCGVYAFFDAFDEPLYVGQTGESIATRIGRHLIGQRSDAVCSGVLDPAEVRWVAVWPLIDLEREHDSKVVKPVLNSLEYAVYHQLARQSRFKAIPNEKAPPKPEVEVTMPACIKKRVISELDCLRMDHPEIQIERRLNNAAYLALKIRMKNPKPGLRASLELKMAYLHWLTGLRKQSAPVSVPDEFDFYGED